MRIVDRQKFLALPGGALFSKYEPCNFSELMIKGDTLHTDFYCMDLASAIKSNDTVEFVDTLTRAKESGCSIAMDFNCESRDGLFDQEQLFAVWEPADVVSLIERLQEAMLEFPSAPPSSPPPPPR